MKINKSQKTLIKNVHSDFFPSSIEASKVALSMNIANNMSTGILNLDSEKLDSLAESLVNSLLYFQNYSIEV